MIVTEIIAALATVSFAVTLWQWSAARKFPLHQRRARPDFAPALTLLKPLKGCDAETEFCVKSWLGQIYPGPMQILFGVASSADPVCALVEKLIAQHPNCDAQLVVCPEVIGPNAKVSTLVQLEALAQNDFIIVSDADVHVPPDFLCSMVAPLQDSKTGLVSCLHSLGNPANLAMHFEAVAINADFWSMVLQGRTIRPLDFAMGAVMAVRSEVLKKIGGFRVLADYLADDYQLGHRVFEAGFKVELCPLVAECREAPTTWRQVWSHQLRWARTVRVCMPGGYFFSIIGNVTLWSVILLCLAFPKSELIERSFSSQNSWRVFEFDLNWLCIPGALFLLARILIAVDLEWRMTRSTRHCNYFWLVPLRDLAAAVLWALSFLGNRIEWRGRIFRVRRGGKLTAVDGD